MIFRELKIIVNMDTGVLEFQDMLSGYKQRISSVDNSSQLMGHLAEWCRNICNDIDQEINKDSVPLKLWDGSDSMKGS